MFVLYHQNFVDNNYNLNRLVSWLILIFFYIRKYMNFCKTWQIIFSKFILMVYDHNDKKITEQDQAGKVARSGSPESMNKTKKNRVACVPGLKITGAGFRMCFFYTNLILFCVAFIFIYLIVINQTLNNENQSFSTKGTEALQYSVSRA